MMRALPAVLWFALAHLALGGEPPLQNGPPRAGKAAPAVAGVAAALRNQWLESTPGLAFKRLPNAKNADAPVVVLVPGLLAQNDSMHAVEQAIASKGLSTATFGYSSVVGIHAAAGLLADELAKLRVVEPNRLVVLVTHSMGGLVARSCIENAATNPGNVSGLILIAPPNRGSAAAKLSASELAKLFVVSRGVANADVADDGLRTIDDAIGGFFGVAKEELCPGSIALQKLGNARPENGIKYSIIAGTGGPVRAEMVELSLLLGGIFFSDQPDAKASLDQIAPLAKADEWTSGRGDGVVSVKSARLDGVDDFVTIEFAHNDFGTKTSKGSQEAIAEVVSRIISQD